MIVLESQVMRPPFKQNCIHHPNSLGQTAYRKVTEYCWWFSADGHLTILKNKQTKISQPVLKALHHLPSADFADASSRPTELLEIT